MRLGVSHSFQCVLHIYVRHIYVVAYMRAYICVCVWMLLNFAMQAAWQCLHLWIDEDVWLATQIIYTHTQRCSVHIYSVWTHIHTPTSDASWSRTYKYYYIYVSNIIEWHISKIVHKHISSDAQALWNSVCDQHQFKSQVPMIKSSVCNREKETETTIAILSKYKKRCFEHTHRRARCAKLITRNIVQKEKEKNMD